MLDYYTYGIPHASTLWPLKKIIWAFTFLQALSRDLISIIMCLEAMVPKF